MTRKRALLIVNMKSRRGADLAGEAIDHLGRAEDLDVVTLDCRDPEQLSRTIMEHREGADLVIVGGGDGTINAAASGVMEAGLPLGILPFGTANDLARTLGIPLDVEGATRVILEGRTRRIDIGEVNGHPFFNVASIGLSAELALTLTGEIKRRFGRLGYAIAAMRVLARAKPFRAVIRTPERSVRVLTLQIAVGNGRYYGGGNAVSKNATIDDRTLDLYSLEMTKAWKLALMARSFRAGEHGAWREVRAARSAEFEVKTRRPRPVNADGEIITQTPALFRVLPGAVTVFAPPRTEPAS